MHALIAQAFARVIGKSPEPWRRQLDTVPRRVADVERLPPARPRHLALDCDTVRPEVCAPGGEVGVRHGKRHVPRPCRAVQRHRCTIDPRRHGRGSLWVEDQHDAIAASKEDVSPLDECESLETEYRPVEAIGSSEILGVERGLQYPRHGGRRHVVESSDLA